MDPNTAVWNVSPIAKRVQSVGEMLTPLDCPVLLMLAVVGLGFAALHPRKSPQPKFSSVWSHQLNRIVFVTTNANLIANNQRRRKKQPQTLGRES